MKGAKDVEKDGLHKNDAQFTANARRSPFGSSCVEVKPKLNGVGGW